MREQGYIDEVRISKGIARWPVIKKQSWYMATITKIISLIKGENNE